MHVSIIRLILTFVCALKFFVKITLKSLLPTAVFLVAVLLVVIITPFSKVQVNKGCGIAHAQIALSQKCV